MKTHGQFIAKLMKRTGVNTEVARIESKEGVLLDTLLRARREAGLSRNKGTVSELKSLKAAAAKLDALLTSAQVDTEVIVADFTTRRRKK